MRILVLATFIENYRERASYKIRLESAKRMAERGHHVTFLSPARNVSISTLKKTSGNFTVIYSPGLFPVNLRRGGFSFLDALYKTIMVLTKRFDVIYVTNGHRPAQLLPCLVAKLIRKVVIVDERWELLGKRGYAEIKKGIIGRCVGLYDRILELRVSRFYDVIITISNVLKVRFGNGSNVVVLHGGTENKSLKDYEIRSMRMELGLPHSATIFGMSNVGKLDLYNIHNFLLAFQKVNKLFPRLFLLITGSDNEFLSALKNRYSLGNSLISTGWVDFNLYNKYLSACDAFVLPYKNIPMFAAAWPNKFGDYLCLNRPIISNPTGDIRYFFENYNLGLLCDETVEGFYRAMETLLNCDFDLMSFCSDSLYLANEILSFDKRIDSLLDVFKKHVSFRF